MPASTALILYFAFVVLLLWRTRNVAAGTSPALWIPLIWLLIVGSRPITTWFGMDQPSEPDEYLEGSPLDRALFLFLIAGGCIALSRRPIDWKRLWTSNRWMVLFFLYLGISTVWSDYSFVSFKRWVKDSGNVVMVLLVVTDPQPSRAFQTILSRSAFVLIPASVMLIKYFPDLGRYYDRWTGRSYSCGVTMDKNMLGMSLFVFGTWLTWTLAESFLANRRIQRATRHHSSRRKARIVEAFFATPHIARRWFRPPSREWEQRLIMGLMLVLCIWMFRRVHSSTALACSLLAAFVIVGIKFRSLRRRLRHFGWYLLIGGLALAALQATFDLRRTAVSVLGREMTLTGRTDIWETVLAEDTDPLFGVGFYSFWLGERPKRLSEGYHFTLNEAHNGYIETYLNNGWVGVLLLIAMMLAGFHRAKRLAFDGSPFGSLRLALLFGAFAYGVTEAVFNRLGMLWFCIVWACTHYVAAGLIKSRVEIVDLRSVLARHLSAPK